MQEEDEYNRSCLSYLELLSPKLSSYGQHHLHVLSCHELAVARCGEILQLWDLTSHYDELSILSTKKRWHQFRHEAKRRHWEFFLFSLTVCKCIQLHSLCMLRVICATWFELIAFTWISRILLASLYYIALVLLQKKLVYSLFSSIQIHLNAYTDMIHNCTL